MKNHILMDKYRIVIFIPALIIKKMHFFLLLRYNALCISFPSIYRKFRGVVDHGFFFLICNFFSMVGFFKKLAELGGKMQKTYLNAQK